MHTILMRGVKIVLYELVSYSKMPEDQKYASESDNGQVGLHLKVKVSNIGVSVVTR